MQRSLVRYHQQRDGLCSGKLSRNLHGRSSLPGLDCDWRFINNCCQIFNYSCRCCQSFCDFWNFPIKLIFDKKTAQKWKDYLIVNFFCGSFARSALNFNVLFKVGVFVEIRLVEIRKKHCSSQNVVNG